MVSLYLNNLNFKSSNVYVFHIPPNPIDPLFNYSPIDLSILTPPVNPGNSVNSEESILLTSFTSVDQD